MPNPVSICDKCCASASPLISTGSTVCILSGFTTGVTRPRAQLMRAQAGAQVDDSAHCRQCFEILLVRQFRHTYMRYQIIPFHSSKGSDLNTSATTTTVTTINYIISIKQK